MPPVTRVAAVQIDPELMQTEKNLEKILLKTRKAAAGGARLIVFPECALTGYVFTSRQEAFPYAETVPGPAVEQIAAVCKELDVYVIFGLIEKDGDRLYNAAVLTGPKGLIGKHRKIHPPLGALDKFMDKGDIPFTVYKTPVGNIGMLICHDITFPESARVLMLQGADIIAVPTNWPRMLDVVSRYFINTRAVENFVHIVAADRVGTERKAQFLGQSKIVSAAGVTKVEASTENEQIISADLDLAFARQKHIVFIPGVWEMDFLKERRPQFYEEITKL